MMKSAILAVAFAVFTSFSPNRPKTYFHVEYPAFEAGGCWHPGKGCTRSFWQIGDDKFTHVLHNMGISIPRGAEGGLLYGDRIKEGEFDYFEDNLIPGEFTSDGVDVHYPSQKAIWSPEHGGYLVYFYRR